MYTTTKMAHYSICCIIIIISVVIGDSNFSARSYYTLYQRNNLLIRQSEDNVREMWMLSPSGNEITIKQSAMLLSNPILLYDAYTKVMQAGTNLHPNPNKVLNAGLGGACLPRSHLSTHPHSVVTSIEIDPVIIGLQQEYFPLDFELQERHTILLGSLEERVNTIDCSYDCVWIDICGIDNEQIIPLFLSNSKFITDVKKSLISKDGILVINLPKNYHMIDEYCKVFRYCLKVEIREKKGNIILILSDRFISCEALFFWINDFPYAGRMTGYLHGNRDSFCCHDKKKKK